MRVQYRWVTPVHSLGHEQAQHSGCKIMKQRCANYIQDKEREDTDLYVLSANSSVMNITKWYFFSSTGILEGVENKHQGKISSRKQGRKKWMKDLAVIALCARAQLHPVSHSQCTAHGSILYLSQVSLISTSSEQRLLGLLLFIQDTMFSPWASGQRHILKHQGRSCLNIGDVSCHLFYISPLLRIAFS